jgi:hypothetical protein
MISLKLIAREATYQGCIYEAKERPHAYVYFSTLAKAESRTYTPQHSETHACGMWILSVAKIP